MAQGIVDYYVLLGVARDAGEQEIQRAIRDGIRTWSKRTGRPELDKRQEAERMMAQLREARETLLDPARRAAYDQRLAATPPEVAAGTGAAAGDWMSLARESAAVGDHAAALRAAQRAEPDEEARSAGTWIMMAEANVGMGNVQEASFQVRRALQLEPEATDHLYTLADIYERMGEWTKAWNCYDQLEKLQPGTEAPVLGKGAVYIARGDHQGAVGYFEHLMAHGRGTEKVGDYLALALTEWAAAVPQVRDEESYTLTSRQELDDMQSLLQRARQASRDPDIQAGIAHHLDYVNIMAGRHFIAGRMFSRLGCLFLVGSVVSFIILGAVNALPLWFLGVSAAGAGMFFYCFVPRWKVNRYQVTQGGVPY